MSHFVSMRGRDEKLWAKWRGLVSEQQASGQSVSAFCHARGMTSSQLLAWRKRLRESEAPRFVAVEVAPAAEVQRAAKVQHSQAIEVRIGRGRSLVVEPGFDGHHLRALLAVLEAEA